LFGGRGRARADAVCANWTETVLQLGLVRLVVLDIYKHIGRRIRPISANRARSGSATTLEDVVKNREARLPAVRAASTRCAHRRAQNFVSGKEPAYADYIVFGAFQWARRSGFLRSWRRTIPVRAGAAACSIFMTGSRAARPPMA